MQRVQFYNLVDRTRSSLQCSWLQNFDTRARSFVRLAEAAEIQKSDSIRVVFNQEGKKMVVTEKWGIGEGGSEQRLAETFQPTHFVFG